MAQRAVAGAPEDAGYRTQLAQAYLRAGRFLSADQAFADVIRLMPDNDKARVGQAVARVAQGDRAGARAALAEVRNRSEEHTSELQSLMRISYAVLCLKKKTQTDIKN